MSLYTGKYSSFLGPELEAVYKVPRRIDGRDWRETVILYASSEMGSELIAYFFFRDYMAAPTKTKALAIHEVFLNEGSKLPPENQLLLNALGTWKAKQPEDHKRYLMYIAHVQKLKDDADSITSALARWQSSAGRKIPGDIFEAPANFCIRDFDTWQRFKSWSNISFVNVKMLGLPTTLSPQSLLFGAPPFKKFDSMKACGPAFKILKGAGFSLPKCPLTPLAW
jgi:hypothetical protein